jgi:hypothetical protein
MKGSRGYKDATTDPATIRRWWTRNPRANIGLACGASSLVVIDLDVKGDRDGVDTLRRLLAAEGPGESRNRSFRKTVGRTVASRTPSGGWHLFFRQPAGARIRSSAGKLGPGVDVRGQGGYIVLPPSVVADERNWGCYAWVAGAHPHRRRPAALPPALVERLAFRRRRQAKKPAHPFLPSNAHAALERTLHDLARSVEGERNDQLNRAAFDLGRLIGTGCLGRAQAEADLERVAVAIGLGEDPGCGLHGIRATVQSGLVAGIRRSQVPAVKSGSGPVVDAGPQSPGGSMRRSGN